MTLIPQINSDSDSKLIVDYERNWEEYQTPEPVRRTPIRNSAFGPSALNAAILRLRVFPMVDRTEPELKWNGSRWEWK